MDQTANLLNRLLYTITPTTNLLHDAAYLSNPADDMLRTAMDNVDSARRSVLREQERARREHLGYIAERALADNTGQLYQAKLPQQQQQWQQQQQQQLLQQQYQRQPQRQHHPLDYF